MRRAVRRLRLVLLCLVAGAVAYGMLASPLFRIRSVQAEVPPSCREIVEAAVPREQNLFLFRRGPLLRSLRNDPLVADASVTLIPPDTVKVSAQLREPFMRVGLRHGTFDVDRQGVVFRVAADPALPLLVGASFSGELGGTVDPETMRTVTGWLDAARRYRLPRVVKVDYIGGGKCNLALEDGRLLKVGAAERTEDKLAAAEALLALSPRDQDYIDLELADQPVIGWHRIPAKVRAAGSDEAQPDQGKQPMAPNNVKDSDTRAEQVGPGPRGEGGAVGEAATARSARTKATDATGGATKHRAKAQGESKQPDRKSAKGQ